VYFVGAAVGSALSTMAWVHWSWNGVCLLALGLIGLAALRHVTGQRSGDQGTEETVEDPLFEAQF
jgi:hypothetical protein